MLLGVGPSFAVALYSASVFLFSPTVRELRGLVLAMVVAGTVCVEGIFAQFYYWLSLQSPSAFDTGASNAALSKIDAAYFTISTATTTGMGDIHPASQAARLLVTLQMVVSLFLVVLALGLALQRFIDRPSRPKP